MGRKCSSCMVVCFFTVMLCLSRLVTLEEIPVCQEGTAFTAQSCCPCFRDELCSAACPGDYLTIKPASTVSCETKSPAPATTTTPKTMNTTTDINVTTAADNTTRLPSSGNVTDDDDANIGVVCLKCDDTCLKCAWPDGKNCTVCNFLYNETCYSRCPENTIASTNVTQDGAKLCETKLPHDETKEELPIAVIAGGAGGVVVIIIIIIIILVCCYRRRGFSNNDITEKRAMSVILEQQQSADRSGKDDPSGRTARRQGNYENTSTTVPQPVDIERQVDAILRYTRDPTFKETNIKDVPKSDDMDSIYANAAMISLATNTDLSGVKDSELTDKLEIEEIGVAPSAPVHKPVPTSVKQNLPQPVANASKQTKRKRTVKAQPTQPDVHELDDYLDMSHDPVHTTMDAGSAADIDSRPASDLEDYENFRFSEIPQGRLGKQASPHQKTSPEDETEIHANTPGNPEGDDSDLEDYENTKASSKHSEWPKEETSEDLEDYENMKDMDVYENYISPQVHKK